MRTTVDIDDTVLAAARSLARTGRMSLGAAISELARRGLVAPTASTRVDIEGTPFPVLVDSTGHIVTDELVAAHRDV
ncbi:MAG: hypothetical protein ACRCY8_18550 [Dermatophilaceae bacterium]